MIFILFIAQIFWGTAFTEQKRGRLVTDIYIEEKMPDPLLSYNQRIVESKKIGHAAATGQVYDPFSGKEMIRTLAPPSPYYNMTREQAIRLREIETEQLGKEVNIRNSELNQKINGMEYHYKLAQIDQSEKFLDGMKSLDPKSKDYISDRSRLSSEYPLASQNPLILRDLELLDKTHTDIQQNDLILNRQAKIQEEADRERDRQKGRETAARLGGSRGLAMYEEMLAKDSSNPIGVLASMVDAQEQESRLSQLKELEVDEKRFYTPEIGPGGQRTGKEILDTRRIDAFLKTYPTASQASQSSSSREKIAARNFGVSYDQWDPADQADYDFHGQQLMRYRALTGQSKEEKPAPKVKSIDDFF